MNSHFLKGYYFSKAQKLKSFKNIYDLISESSLLLINSEALSASPITKTDFEDNIYEYAKGKYLGAFSNASYNSRILKNTRPENLNLINKIIEETHKKTNISLDTIIDYAKNQPIKKEINFNKINDLLELIK